jgi:hypothetical protein
MRDEENLAFVQELIDREKIRDCLQRYCIGVDRCDEEMLRSSYWPDAHDIHGDFDGTGEEFVAWVLPRLRNLVRTQHFMGNSLIRIDGNFANVETYIRNEDGHEYDLIHGGRYLDRFEKRGREWRVIDRLVMFDFVLENPTTTQFAEGFLGNENIPVGVRHPDDPQNGFHGGLSVGGYLGV